MKWIKNMPLSFYIFAFTAAVFLLQVPPFPGIFLMMMMAPFWSILTINAGFASLAFEAYFGIVQRRWMWAPIAWFGGYFVIALLNQLTFYQLSNNFAQFNAGKTLPFSSDAASLVIAGNDPYVALSARMFVQSYDLPIAYKNVEKFGTSAYRISSGKNCDRIRADGTFEANGVRVQNFKSNGKWDACIVKSIELPQFPTVTASVTTEKIKSWWLPYILNSIRIKAVSGKVIELKSGSAAPLSWFPQPILGCFLISQPASWNCQLHFREEKRQGLGAQGTLGEASTTVVAEALQLKPVVTDTRKSIEKPIDVDLLNAVASQTSRSISVLDKLIADPTRTVASRDLTGLAFRTDVLATRAEGMTTALFKVVDNFNLWENNLNLQRLIAALKPEDFNRIGSKLLAEFEARPDLRNNVFSGELLRRLGDLGPISSKLLAKVALSDKGSKSAAALLGLCSIGTPAAEYAKNVVEILTSTKRSDERHSAAYVTLLRMGREDLADTDPDAGSSYGAESYTRLRQLNASERTAKYCVKSINWKRL